MGIGMTAPSYESYLRLDAVLGALDPVTPRAQEAEWIAERFFMVCHLASELWAGQVLAELERAAARAESDEWAAADQSLSRALLHHLPTAEFLRFRDALDGVSAAESRQFGQLLEGRRHTSLRRLAAAVARHGSGDPVHIHDGDDGDGDGCAEAACRCARGIDRIAQVVRAWRLLHVAVARRLVGDLPGTGGTDGVPWLAQRAGGESPGDAAGDRDGCARERWTG
jgi:tryptophan 2,3-dioxygenase